MFVCMVLIHTYDKNLLFTKYHGKQWGYEDTVVKNQTLLCPSKTYTLLKTTD